jgi:hypothetical protein
LTGGVLVSRNKEYIIFYRGNDFVTPKVRKVLVEQQQQAITQQDQEELARLKASASITPISSSLKNPLVAGTLAETREATSRWGDSLDDELRKKENNRLILAKHTTLLKNMNRKLILVCYSKYTCSNEVFLFLSFLLFIFRKFPLDSPYNFFCISRQKQKLQKQRWLWPKFRSISLQQSFQLIWKLLQTRSVSYFAELA